VINMRVLLAGLCAGIVSTAASHAAPVPLNVRTGLWEMTSSGQTTGAPAFPASILAQLPPERRAKIEAAMNARRTQQSTPRVTKQCITEKSLHRGFNPDSRSGPELSCQTTVASSTATIMEVHENCTGREKVKGTFRFEALTPDTMNGTIDMVMTDGTHTMTIKRVISGKWLSADCGNVKSRE
jgi:hypothetical protein